MNASYHNMEWVASKAVEFIQEDSDSPFLLYFNPTVPHSGGSVYEALANSTCRETPGGLYDSDLMVKGMTLEYGSCDAYRNFVLGRMPSDGDTFDPTNDIYLQQLGSAWLDDAVGALIHALVDKGELREMCSA